jgi:hypothetical protein
MDALERYRKEAARVRANAHSKVWHAVRSGKLKPPHKFKCVDCQRPATEYDHRKYAEPLVVDPVCGTCNRMRGEAMDLREIVAERLK